MVPLRCDDTIRTLYRWDGRVNDSSPSFTSHSHADFFLSVINPASQADYDTYLEAAKLVKDVPKVSDTLLYTYTVSQDDSAQARSRYQWYWGNGSSTFYNFRRVSNRYSGHAY